MGPHEVGPVSCLQAERTFQSQAARRPPLRTVISYSSATPTICACSLWIAREHQQLVPTKQHL